MAHVSYNELHIPDVRLGAKNALQFMWSARHTWLGWGCMALGIAYFAGVCLWGPRTIAPPFSLECGFLALATASFLTLFHSINEGQWRLLGITLPIGIVSVYGSWWLQTVRFVF